jgi:UPF0176 protein
MNIVVAALYQFKRIDAPMVCRDQIDAVAKHAGTLGTLLIAKEGINGTISGSRENAAIVIDFLRSQGFFQLELKYSHANEDPFLRMKVVVKKEIVTLGRSTDPCQLVGTYVDSQDWNALISREDILLIDTRNDYEYELGHFKDAQNPDTTCFRGFPKYVESIDCGKYKSIAMYCTGGIRCEKASSYMLNEGFEEVFHLKGGILQYLEDIPIEESLWEGDCFVFDRRVALGHGLKITGHKQCFACRRALTPIDILHAQYIEGVACHNCCVNNSNDQKKAFAQRQYQVMLAKHRSEKHIG